MKNLIAELLVKLAQKEEESKELVAQVEALEIVVTALLRQMAKPEQEALIDNVEGALEKADKALYEAKHMGRNNILLSEEIQTA